MAAISEYENVPARESRPAASHTNSTVFALPTLQVMTRVLRKTPVPIMLATLTAIAPHAPTPRVSSVRALDVAAPIGPEYQPMRGGSFANRACADLPRRWNPNESSVDGGSPTPGMKTGALRHSRLT